MNKKVLTLCAGLLLAGNATAWGQVWIDASATDVTLGNYKIAVNDVSTTFNAFVQDNSSMTGKAGFPNVSPFAISVENGAKPIQKLDNVNNDQPDSRYFQFVVGGEESNGKEVLTMVWVDQDEDGPVAGHYELQVENVTYANISANPIKLDRTLWKVTAKKDAAGTVLYYELQNKATDAILQLSQNPITGANAVTAKNGAQMEFKEVSLNIVTGQTDWRWSDGEEAALKSKVDAASNEVVLQNTLRAQYSNGTTLHLVKKTVDLGTNKERITLAAIIGNSNAELNNVTGTWTDANDDEHNVTYEALTFEAWEANPIILTADQLNSELGAELLTAAEHNGKMHFTFSPDVKGDTNIMTSYDFKAEDAKPGADRVPGDAPDGFVRFINAANDKQVLYVDTVYYDDNTNGRYDLKLNVGEITYARHAVIDDELEVSGGKLIDPDNNNHELTNAEMYGTGTYANKKSVQTYVQMKRQSNFRPIFYPATQSLRLQVEMLYKASKNDVKAGQSWWQQIAEDATDAASTPSSGNIKFADAAEDPTIDVVSNGTAARGYYPSYAYDVTEDVDGQQRLVQYKLVWGTGGTMHANGGVETNGYCWIGDDDSDKPLWNAVGNVYNPKGSNASWGGTISKTTSSNDAVWLIDPAWNASSTTENGANVKKKPAMRVFSPVIGRTAYSNLINLTSLTPGHVVLTAGKHDDNDKQYNGLNTFISLAGLRQNTDLSQAVDIEEGFYYIQNANEAPTQLAKVGDYRYEDLSATNAMFTYWNTADEKWDRGYAGTGNGADASHAETTTLGEVIKTNRGLNEDLHEYDNASKGNLIYSTEKLMIPSAQWYIKGNGDHYVMINRESGRQWGTEYWWKIGENVYANQATYTDAAGQQQVYRDTIRITPVPSAELTNPYMGYLNLSQAEVQNDTTTFAIGMTSMGDIKFSLVAEENGVLKMKQDPDGNYKLERVVTTDVDPYVSAGEHFTDDLIYGYHPASDKDSTMMLKRAKYYIYKDDVSANTGLDEDATGVRQREYIVLENGQYKTKNITVEFATVKSDDEKTLYSINRESGVDEYKDPNNTSARRAFYIKQMTPNANEYVLVDPYVVSTTDNNTTGQATYGARVFVNQQTTELQPGSLVSNGYANSYANSILTIAPESAQNYFDIRREGADLDTVKIFVANNPSYLLGENSNVEGAEVGLLELREVSNDICNALFVDTANLSNAACPRFLLGVRDTKKFETSNLNDHNRHLYTEAAYLVNLKDSAAVDKVYKYNNAGVNAKDYYRLGFLNGTHYAYGEYKNLPGSYLVMEDGKEFNLTALGETGFDLPVFAFRFCDDTRENFYIETTYDGNKKGWIEIHNGVAVVTDDIQRAEVFSYEATDEDATANETIAAEGAVSVVATDGAVIVKGAEGKNVVIATILGKVVANETINSDNETIAVPAGIAVVSVDGESFKVVVK